MLGVYWNCGLAAGEPFVICPSPFEQLARTNHAPIDSETGRIRELILDAENDLIQLEDLISRLHHQCDELKAYVDQRSTISRPTCSTQNITI